MLKNVLEFKGVKAISKKEQIKVNGGSSSWPRTERECELCGGEWYPIPFPAGGLCALSSNSPCA